ncbi:MAG: catalase family protein [Methylococcales bacterium]|nr:catalase family protein [Methylococcales bacterium]
MSHNQLAQEIIPVDEDNYIEALSARLKAKIIQDNPTGIMRRDAHPKMHGLVKAEFIIEPDLAAELQVGVFKEPKTYQAWIRFSNQSGDISPDKVRDIRGMAIKLMGVTGDKILEHKKEQQTHDFILISTNVFVTKDVAEFDNLIKAITSNIFAKIKFMLTHWRVAWNLYNSIIKFANPLQIRYFSTTPYLFGNTAVKYSAIPHINTPDTIPKNSADDYLRLAMIKQLQDGEAMFDFAVQLQTNADTMSIEDSGHEWSESLSPFRKVASIRIFQQEFDNDSQKELGENLSFNPWHALPEHRPLGGINRTRKVIYQAISSFRHEYNHIPEKEPISN